MVVRGAMLLVLLATVGARAQSSNDALRIVGARW
jgi:hypothetical protein